MTKITLSDIATKANISVASVSRVLKKPHLTSPQTQLRVYQAIEGLNMDTSKNFKPFQPIHNSRKILIIDNQLFSKSLINLGLEQILKKELYQLFYLQFPYNNKSDIHHIIRYVAQNAFDGIIINDAPYLKTLISYKNTLPPIVLVNHFSLDFICVHFDHLLIGYQMTKYLTDNSHTQVAILLNNDQSIDSALLLKGYKQALLRANITVEPRYIIQGCFTYQHAKSAIKKLINGRKTPSAVICADNFSLSYLDEIYYKDLHHQLPDSMVLGALHQANESKSKLTKPLTISYFSASKELKYNELDNLCRINKPLFKMGQKSATLLCDIIKDTTRSIRHNKIINVESISY